MGLTLRWAASAALFHFESDRLAVAQGISFEGRVEWKAGYLIGR